MILTNTELEAELLGLAGQLAAAQCRFLGLLVEFDRRGGWGSGPGLRSCAHWLCWRAGISLRTAAEHVRVAHALTALPAITASHVETVVRAARRLGADPADVVDRRSLSWYWDDDGSLVLRARLPAADGTALIAALDVQAHTHPRQPPPRRLKLSSDPLNGHAAAPPNTRYRHDPAPPREFRFGFELPVDPQG